jgi:hypothetical protein
MRERKGMVWAATLAALGAVAPCEASAAPPIIGGQDAPDGNQNVMQITTISDRITCNGSLIAPNLLLTARHCLVQSDISFDCDPTKPNGGNTFDVGAAIAADKVRIFKSDQAVLQPLGLAPTAVGRALFADNTITLCGHDVAILLLDQDVPGAVRKPLRLSKSSRVGEPAYALGWGAESIFGGRPPNLQRLDVNILALGPANYQMIEGLPLVTTVERELVVGQSACTGDSGSPLVAAETGAIIGVASYVTNVYPERSNPPYVNPVTGIYPWCGEGSAAIYQTLENRPFIAQAFAASGHRAWLEGKPEPTLAFGEACTADELCDTGPCVAGVCAKPCDAGTCPEGYACLNVGGQSVCGPPPSSGPSGAAGAVSAGGEAGAPVVVPNPSAANTNDGCAASGRAQPAGEVAVVLGLLAVTGARRRRRR